MKKFIITESEKERILNMHKNAIKRQYLSEQSVSTEPGSVIAQARSQDLVDGGMNYIGFSVNGDPQRKTYYYNCTASFDSTPAEQVGSQKAGAIFDEDGNVKTVAELGIKGDYTQQFRTACGNIYTWIANKRKTFCADPKNKTKPNFAWNCPKSTSTPSQVGSATSEPSKEEKLAKVEPQVTKGLLTKTIQSDGYATYTAAKDGKMTSSTGGSTVPVKKGQNVDSLVYDGFLFVE